MKTGKKITKVATKKIKAPKREEIRIVDPSSIVWDTVTTLADKEKRSYGKQAEYMLELYIEGLPKSSK